MSIKKPIKNLFRPHSCDEPNQLKSRKSEVFSAPVVASSTELYGAQINTISGYTELRNQRIFGANYGGNESSSLRVFDSNFTDCSFKEASFRDFRMWSTEMMRCSFLGADLCGAALGGVLDGRRNRFIDVDFSGADMRRTSWVSASFERCTFKNTNLEGVNFQGSTFDRCVFEGEVRDVIFNRHAFKREELPPNEMIEVDFSQANLRFVGFRNLDLNRVKFPNDAKHLVFEDYRQTIERAVSHLRKEDDPIAKKLCFFLANELRWAVPGQSRGILNVEDLTAVAGITAQQRLILALS